MQEMKLLEGAYDGDVEGVRNVPVDATYPVRLTLRTYKCKNTFHLMLKDVGMEVPKSVVNPCSKTGDDGMRQQ